MADGLALKVVMAPVETHLRLVAELIGAATRGGHAVVLAAERPSAVLAAALGPLGIDLGRVHFVDCVSAIEGVRPLAAPNTVFVHSPTMLEMMVMRLEQQASRAAAPVHVVVDSLSALAHYNGTPPVVEFSHYLANRLRTRGLGGTFLVRDVPEGRSLRDQAAHFLDVAPIEVEP